MLDAEGIDVVGDVPRPRPEARRHPGSASSRSRRAGSTTTGSPSGARPRPTGSSASARCRCRTRRRGRRGAPHRGARARRPASRVRTRTTTGRSTTRRTSRCGRRSRRPACRSRSIPRAWPTCPARRARSGDLMAPGTHHALILLFDQQMTLSNLVYGGVLERHPELKVVVLECGGGWIAHWMDRLDEFLESYGWATAPLSLTPTEYFRRQCWISFDPGERTRRRCSAARRRRPLHLGVGLPAQRRQVSRAWSTSCASTPTAWTRRRAPGLYGLNALDLYGIAPAVRERDARSRSIRGGTRRRRHRRAGAHRRRRASATGAIAAIGRIDDDATRRRHRRRRPARHARLRRHPHALRRAAALGSDRVARVVARRHHAAHRQLRVHARAGQARRRRVAAADAQPRRGHVGRRARGGRRRSRGGTLRRLPRRPRRPRRRERRRQRRPLRGAPLRDGRRRVGAHARPTTRSPRCRTLVRDAMRDGAIGFTSSQLELHVAHDGRGVPSNHAAPEELVALAAVLARVRPRRRSSSSRARSSTGYDDDDRALIRAMARAVGPAGAPQHAHAACRTRPTAGSAASSSRETAAADGLDDPPDVRGEPAGRALRARLHVPVRRDAELPRHAHAARRRARASACAIPALRDADAQPSSPIRRGRSFVFVWQVDARSRRCASPSTSSYVDRIGHARSPTSMGVDPLDAFLDLSLADDLETQFVLAAPPDPKRRGAATER